MLIPVLPPTAASTIASSVVGTCTTRTPRIQVAATNPARSVTAPPPSETTTSLRVSPIRPQTSQQKPATASALPSSASGTSTRCASTPGGLELGPDLLGDVGQRRLVDDQRGAGAEAGDRGRQLGPRTPRPTSTG